MNIIILYIMKFSSVVTKYYYLLLLFIYFICKWFYLVAVLIQ
jgi:hypothetical protein